MSAPFPPADIDRLRAGDPRTVGRTLTLVENRPEEAESVLEAIGPAAASVPRVGITGPPGAGKSTLVAQLVRADLAAGRSCAVVAVDPSSEQTGGAVLGDRVRLGADDAAGARFFFRSVATRGARGGVSRTCADLLRVLAASGKDRLYLETVGTGQAELEVSELADTVVLVLVPESGDFIQTLKAGLLEVADILVVNKRDREGADELAEELRTMVHLSPARADGWAPAILTAAARTGDGVAEVAAAIGRHLAHLGATGEGARRRARQAAREVRRRILARFESWVDTDRSVQTDLAAQAQDVAAGRRTPGAAATRLWATALSGATR